MPRGADTALLLVLAVVLAMAVAVLLLLRHRRGSSSPTDRPDTADQEHPLLGVVVNPIKVADLHAYLARIEEACATHGWDTPLCHETTPEEPGADQARASLERGARTVLACGGDGTVRSVASALAGSDVPLALMPEGTGNLFARNLALPVTDSDACLEIALTGDQRQVDVGVAEVDVSGEDEAPARHTFLVMAGLGFDAEVMAHVEPRLKKRVGWLAYVVAGAQQLRGRETRVVIRVDGGPPLSQRVRSVVIGNCGSLTGGVQLMPDARVDDGWLDVVVVAPRGVAGWAAVGAAVLTRSRRGHPMVRHLRCRSIHIAAERPLRVQMDGDPVGTARSLRIRVDSRALRIRVPAAPH